LKAKQTHHVRRITVQIYVVGRSVQPHVWILLAVIFYLTEQLLLRILGARLAQMVTQAPEHPTHPCFGSIYGKALNYLNTKARLQLALPLAKVLR
jgi:hypothetical protein